jgi:hypothetical protein
MLSQINMDETERKMRWGHLIDLYREAEVHRLQARERRGRLNLTQPAVWVAAKLEAAGTSFRQRFVSPCGQFTLWQVKSDC